MNRILSIVMIPAIAATLALAGFGVAYAQTSSSNNLHVTGMITAINPAATPAPTVTITPEGTSAVVVTVVANAVITKEGTGTISLGGLAVGNRVVAAYDRTTMNAITITVKSPVEEREALVGTIKSIGSSSFVLTTKHQGDVTVTVDSNTLYRVPSVNNATLVDFNVRDRVAVMAVQSGGENLALHVNLIPGKALGLSEDKGNRGSPSNPQSMDKPEEHGPPAIANPQANDRSEGE